VLARVNVLTAPISSIVEACPAVKTLTLASTGATATTFTVKTGENDLNVVDNIVFTGSGDTTLAVDGTDLVAAAAATDGGTSAASVIASDTGTGTSRVALQEAAGAALNLSAEYASIVTICADASAGTFLFDEEHLSDYDLIFQGSSLVSALGSGMQSTAVVYEDDAAAGEANKRFLPISSGRHTRFVSLQGQKYVSDAKVIASNIYSLELTSATEELSDCASTISEKYRNDKAAKAKKTLNLSEHKKGERWSEEEKELLKKKKKELRKRNAMAMRNKK
jgi:hypothetical protein